VVPEAQHCTRTAPNQALEPTPNSVRSYVAPAIGRGLLPAFGAQPVDGGEIMSYGLTRVAVPAYASLCRQGEALPTFPPCPLGSARHHTA
jgi:hypothetical protein